MLQGGLRLQGERQGSWLQKGPGWLSTECGVWEDFADLVVFLPIRERTRLAG